MQKNVMFLEENAPAYPSMKSTVKLHESNYEFVHQVSYSIDMFPSDYCLFPNLKSRLKRKSFESNEDVECENYAHFSAL